MVEGNFADVSQLHVTSIFWDELFIINLFSYAYTYLLTYLLICFLFMKPSERIGWQGDK
jgi:hypothetical protein